MSAEWTALAMKTILKLRSFTPVFCKPLTPSILLLSWRYIFELSMLVDWGFSPGFINYTMSGTTTSVPVKIVLSPGFASSTVSPRRITSIDRGMEPAGMSVESSWRRTFCQSINTLAELSSSKSVELRHRSLSHRTGCVNLNYCSIAGQVYWHWRHLKVPSCSSGLTSVVRVTVP